MSDRCKRKASKTKTPDDTKRKCNKLQNDNNLMKLYLESLLFWFLRRSMSDLGYFFRRMRPLNDYWSMFTPNKQGDDVLLWFFGAVYHQWCLDSYRTMVVFTTTSSSPAGTLFSRLQPYGVSLVIIMMTSELYSFPFSSWGRFLSRGWEMLVSKKNLGWWRLRLVLSRRFSFMQIII